MVVVSAGVSACGDSGASGAPGGLSSGGATGAGGSGGGAGGYVANGGATYATGSTTSTGGTTTGTGNTTGSGGTTASNGGAATSGNYTFVGTVLPAPGTTANGSLIAAFPSCESATCSSAHCVTAALLDSQAPGQSALLGQCPPSDGGISYCVPDDFIATLGKFTLKTCTSLIGAEGRCISTCVPQVAAQMDQLPQDVCDETERCAPCYLPYPPDPGQSDASGACSTGVKADGSPDAPTQPKVVFASCGAGRGLCVPKSLVPANLQTALPVDTCTGTDELCAPIEKVKDLNYKFPSCTPQIPPAPPDPTQPAACVPQYIITYQAQTNAFASLLVKSDCVLADDICAPCKNPLDGTDTGACN